MSTPQKGNRRESEDTFADAGYILPVIGKEFPTAVIPLIRAAQKSLDVVVFDWRWYGGDVSNPVQQFNRAIFEAVKRNVKVRVITNARDVIARMKTHGIQAEKLVTSKLVHSKLMIIDDEVVILGSHNYTQSAFCMNLEASIIVKHKATAEEYKKYFLNIWPLLR